MFMVPAQKNKKVGSITKILAGSNEEKNEKKEGTDNDFCESGRFGSYSYKLGLSFYFYVSSHFMFINTFIRIPPPRTVTMMMSILGFQRKGEMIVKN